MKQIIPIYLLTTKDSVRKKTVINRLKKLKLDFHIVYGLNAKNLKDKEILKSFYNKEKSKKNTNRNLNFFDIACSYGHLKIYKELINKKITAAVIMEDDCFPSKKLYDWVRISLEATSKYDIIQFCAPDGYLYNKEIEKIDKFFNIYKSATKLTTTTCYQINLKTCHFILKKTNNKVCSTADWPINFLTDNIKQYFVLPFISSVISSHLESTTNLNIQVARIKRQKIKEKIPCYKFFSALYYLLHIPFLLRGKIDYNFYREEYLSRKTIYLKSFVVNKFFNIENINKNKSFYFYDLRKNLDSSLEVSKENFRKKKIILYLSGGLGNQLFQYAAAKNLAIKNNARLIIDTKTSLLRFGKELAIKVNHLGNKLRIKKSYNDLKYINFSFIFFLYRIKKKFFKHKIFNFFFNNIIVDEMGLTCFNKKILNLKFKKNLYLMGYFQSEKYFYENKKDIINDLFPKRPKDKKYHTLKEKIILNNSVAICVRMYEELLNPSELGGISNAHYYNKSINLIKGNKKLNYFLFSTKKSNLEKIISQIPKLKRAQQLNKVFMITSDRGYNNPMDNLWLLSFFRKIIISNSSLYWWGVYFAKIRYKKIQYFISKKFLNKDSLKIR